MKACECVSSRFLHISDLRRLSLVRFRLFIDDGTDWGEIKAMGLLETIPVGALDSLGPTFQL